MTKVRRILTFNLNTEERVLDAVVRSSFLNLLARILGYAKHFSIAIFLGFSHGTDGFFMALSLMGIFLIFADVFDSIGVPQLVKARLEDKEKFHHLAGILFSFTTLLSLLSLFLSIVLAPLILKAPAGFKEEALHSTRVSYFLLIPYMFFCFYFQHFGAVLRSLRRFTLYFVGELIYSLTYFLFITAGLLITKDYRILAIGSSLAQFFATLYMLYVARQFLYFKLSVDYTTKKLLFQFSQLSLLYGVLYLYILVDKVFASFLGEKAVSALAYGLLLSGSLKGILRIESIAITSLAEVGGSLEKLNFYAKRILLITLPVVLISFALSYYIVKALFGYGAFSHIDINLTSEALRYYSLSLPFMFLWPLIYRVFQIREKLLSISMIAIVGVVLNLIFNYIFIFLLNLGITGICLGTFVAYISICTLGYAMLFYMRERRQKNV